MASAVNKTVGTSKARSRPQFRNIHISQIVRYRLPLAGLVSILHRVSGAVMFLIGLPLILYLFQQSIVSELSYERFRAFVSNGFARVLLVGLIWAYLHHFCAGLRHLLMDLDIGLDKESGRTSAAVVLAVSLVLTLIFALKIFGLF